MASLWSYSGPSSYIFIVDPGPVVTGQSRHRGDLNCIIISLASGFILIDPTYIGHIFLTSTTEIPRN